MAAVTQSRCSFRWNERSEAAPRDWGFVEFTNEFLDVPTSEREF